MEVILHITPLCSLLYTLLKDILVHVFAGQVKIVSHWFESAGLIVMM